MKYIKNKVNMTGMTYLMLVIGRCGKNLDINNTNRFIFLKHPWNSHSRIGAKAFFVS